MWLTEPLNTEPLNTRQDKQRAQNKFLSCRQLFGTKARGKSEEMDQLTEEEISEFREIFNLVDKDGGGSITKTELGELMDTLGIDASPEEIDAMISEIDQDGNGDIDFEEFVAVMSRKVNATYTSDQVKGAFKVFEGKNGSGYVKADALIRALCTYGIEKLTEEQATDLVNQLEVDPNGMINYALYVEMMMSS